MLRNTLRGGGVKFIGENILKVYDSTLLALRSGGWVSNIQKNTLNVTLEWLNSWENCYIGTTIQSTTVYRKEEEYFYLTQNRHYKNNVM